MKVGEKGVKGAKECEGCKWVQRQLGFRVPTTCNQNV